MYFHDFTIFILSRSHTRRRTGLSPKREVLPGICEQNSVLNSSTYLGQVQWISIVFDYTE